MLDGKNPNSKIEQLVDELESYAEKSPWFLPNKIVIPDDEFFRLTQMIRERLPAELSEARSMLEKRDLILKNAQEEHRRIMDTAERRLEDMTSEEKVVVVAHQEAQRMIDAARLEAESIKRDALLYTAELLEEMERQFKQTLSTIEKGRQFLETEITDQVEENLAAVEEAPKAVSDVTT